MKQTGTAPGLSVERHGSFASVTAVNCGDMRISEVGAILMFAQRRSRFLMAFDLELGRAQNLSQRQGYLFSRVAVGRLQHPD
jgi:hypothetical protein